MLRMRFVLGYGLTFLLAGLLGGQEPAAKQSIVLRVLVPTDSTELLIEGKPTRQTGRVRRFESPAVAPGDYEYTLKATWIIGGRIFINERTVTVRPGKENEFDLGKEYDDSTVRVIWVPTPQEVVDRMLELAEVKKTDVLFDLGCGDGRIVCTAARKFGIKAVGVDLDPQRIKEAKARAKKDGVEELVEFRQGDALKVADIGKATVVTLYMLPEFNKRLQPILLKELKPGARVVAHDYRVGDWKYEHSETFRGPERDHYLYRWRIAEPKDE